MASCSSSAIVPRGLVHLYLCECTIVGVSANSGVVSFLNAVDGAALDDSLNVTYPPHLDMHLNWLGDRGAIALAKTLLGMQWLTSLDIRGCGVGEAGVAALCTTIERHKSLCSLDLRQNAVYASSGRLLAKLVARRPVGTPLLVLCDIDQLPPRIARELLEAIGKGMACAQGFESASRVVYSTVVGSPLASSNARASDASVSPDVVSSSPILQEVLTHEDWLVAHFAQLGPIVPLLVLDASLNLNYGTAAVLGRLASTVATASELRRQPSAFLQTIKRCFPTDDGVTTHRSTVPPYASDAVWGELAHARGVVLHEQWETLQRCVRDAQQEAGGTSAGDDDGCPDPATTQAAATHHQMDVLARVVSGVAATTARDLPFFAPVEAHLDAVYTAVVVEAYEQRRELSLVCQQIAYLIQNNKHASHAAWRAAAGSLLRPARIDVTACTDVVKQFLFKGVGDGTYAPQRVSMVRQALALLPPLMVTFLLDVVCEAAVTQLYAKQAIKRVPLEVLMQHRCAAAADAPVEDSSDNGGNDVVVHVPKPPSSTRSSTQQQAASTGSMSSYQMSITAATAVANSAPIVLCSDLATILGSVRTAVHIKQLVRHYGQWLRWQYFCGHITDDQLRWQACAAEM